MNRSKILGASALASLMSAGVAQAEMSVSGYLLGAFADSDGGGVTQYHTSETVTVSYSDTLDNGMGITVSMDITDTLDSLVTIDLNQLGSINFSGDAKADSALDKVDTSTACFSMFWCSNAYNTTTYDDGDTHSFNSVRYVSPSINGFTVQASVGSKSANDVEGTNSLGISGSIMGVTLKAGFADIDFDAGGMGYYDGNTAEADKTPSMYAIGYSLAGLDLGYAFYDSDDAASSEETQYGVGTSVMGMYVGAQFGQHDTTGNDTDYMTLSAIKNMGAASFSYEYIEVDQAGVTDNDTDTHILAYSIGF